MCTSPPVENVNDTRARAYLVAVLNRDADGLRVLLGEVAADHAAWDFIDALGATARDVIEQLDAGTRLGAELLSARLVRDALTEVSGP